MTHGVVASVFGNADAWVAQWGYFLVFFMVLAQCAGLPLPATAVLLAAETAARKGDLRLVEVITLGSLAAIVGSTIGYTLGRMGGRDLMLRMAATLHARESRVDAMERFFERHGGKAIFIGRWVVFVRLWGSIAAGAARMRLSTFMFWNVLGSILWVASLGLIAFVLAAVASGIGDWLDIGGWILLPVIVTGFVVAELRRRRTRLHAAVLAGVDAADAAVDPTDRPDVNGR